MTRFSGHGKPTGTWTRRRYDRDGNLVGERAPAKRKGPSYHVRFRPFVGHDPTPEDAAALGLARTKDKGTVFNSERDLNRYLAMCKERGQDVGWKDA